MKNVQGLIESAAAVMHSDHMQDCDVTSMEAKLDILSKKLEEDIFFPQLPYLKAWAISQGGAVVSLLRFLHG